ncbi:MAG TPA: RimK/LysX family protein [Polyangia bacterium]|nr:RimK/LysX family protein [Polyangia bacterium]
MTIGPGESRAVAIPLAGAGGGGGGRSRTVPAWVVVGARPGPRVSVVAAPRGTEAVAARAAAHVAARLDPSGLAGSVVVVPVLRPGGRLVPARGAPASMAFPGEAGGDRASRDAFKVFSDVVVGAQALILLGVPNRGRRGLLVARVAPDDPRARRLAVHSGAVVVVQRAPRPGSLVAAAAAVQVPAVELFASAGSSAADPLANGARAVLAAAGVLVEPFAEPLAETSSLPPPLPGNLLRVVAPADGFLEPRAAAGDLVRLRQELGHLEPWLPGPTTTLVAPSAALVVEAAPPGAVRAGATLFTLVPAPRRSPAARPQPGSEPAAAQIDGKTQVGWVELVALPGLGVERLKAKIDTGARTSALHVTRMRVVDTTGGPHRRPILEITVPAGRRPIVVRVTVRAYAMVRDTSGRIERRPVIETALKLGPLQRRITVTLTNRGDMLYPMLVGRTALGPGLLVDPSRRYLLGTR